LITGTRRNWIPAAVGACAALGWSPVAVARAKDEACDICRANPQAGFGEYGTAIGFPKEIADALMDLDD
jgi:hypothetical protein